MDIPRSMTNYLANSLTAIKELGGENNIVSTEKVIERLSPNANSETRFCYSNALTQLRVKGMLLRPKGANGWKLTKYGSEVYSRLSEITIFESKRGEKDRKFKAQKSKTEKTIVVKAVKKPLSEIEPIPIQQEINLSNEGLNFAKLAGNILDENQQYRNAMKAMLFQLAGYLGATITFKHEGKTHGTSSDRSIQQQLDKSSSE